MIPLSFFSSETRTNKEMIRCEECEIHTCAELTVKVKRNTKKAMQHESYPFMGLLGPFAGALR